MITWTGPVRVFACLEPTDMRKSFDGLCGVVELGMGRLVETGSLFLFFNRRRDRVKILQAVEDGMVLFYKRLERGTFELPAAPTDASGSSLEMRAGDLSLLLAGIDLSSVRHRRWWRQPAAREALPLAGTTGVCQG
jgi:transposase